MKLFTLIIGGSGLYILSNYFSHFSKIMRTLPKYHDPTALYGPNGIIETDTYVRDDNAEDRTKIDEWSEYSLKKHFNVVLGDLEAKFGPMYASLTKSSKSEWLDPMYGKAAVPAPQLQTKGYNVDNNNSDINLFLQN